MWNILVTGANRGLGLEFVRQLASGYHPNTTNVIATCRDPQKAQELQAIKKSAKTKVHIIKLDVTNDADIENLQATVQNHLGPNQGLNLLINNAGYATLLNFEETTKLEMEKLFSINTTAPMMVTKALLPLLRYAADQCPESGMSCFRAAVVNISTGVASFCRKFDEPGSRQRMLMGYSSSKAALNMWTRYFAMDSVPWGILVVLLHPGWVQTDMGTSEAPLTPQESISDMLNTIASRNESHHGSFFDKSGNVISW